MSKFYVFVITIIFFLGCKKSSDLGNHSAAIMHPLDSITNITGFSFLAAENKVLIQVSNGVNIMPNMSKILELDVESGSINRIFSTESLAKGAEKGDDFFYMPQNAKVGSKVRVVLNKYNRNFSLKKQVVLDSPSALNILTSAIKYHKQNIYFGTYGTDGYDYTKLYKIDTGLNVVKSLLLDPAGNSNYLSSEISLIRALKDGNLLFIYRYVGNKGMLVEKRDLDLNIVWSKKFATTGAMFLSSFVEANGAYYIFGNIATAKTGDFDFMGYRMDNNGDAILMKQYVSDEFDWRGTAAIQTADGNILFACSSNGQKPPGLNTIYVFKVNPDLEIISKRSLGSNAANVNPILLKLGENKNLLSFLDNGYSSKKPALGLVCRFLDDQGLELVSR